MKKIMKFASVLLALIMLAGLLSGCTQEQAQSVIDTVTDVVDILIEEEDSGNEEKSPEAEHDYVPQPASASDVVSQPASGSDIPAEAAQIDEDGVYTTCEDVALYIHTYGHLPSNFITKKDAKAEGWPGGSLEPYCPGKCIGGDYFGNYEGQLPDAKGRKWTECDINTLGADSRGAERIIFSNDGLIYYTNDHYETFTLLYGEP